MRGSPEAIDECRGALVLVIGEHAVDGDMVDEHAAALAAFIDDEVADRSSLQRQLAARARSRCSLRCHRAASGAVNVAITAGFEPGAAR